MNRYFWIFLFLIVFISDLIAVQYSNETWRYISKPLLMPCLLAYFFSATRHIKQGMKRWILAALVFSWVGDVLLMFEPEDPVFFLLGLLSFLIAHIFYIIFFHFIRIRENIRGNVLLILPVLIYYVMLMIILSPYLGDLKLPVRIYGVVISFMLLLALHSLFIKNKKAAAWMVPGALLFIISDSLLAINKFYIAFSYAGPAVMLTYGVAQLFITHGAINYFRGLKKR